MPMPKPEAGESQDEFLGRCMSAMKDEFPDQDQRVAVCMDAWQNKAGHSVLRRTIHPEVKMLDAKQGLVEYVASDQTLDSYREVIRADGWRFNNFKKNAPFVDSHDYTSIEKLLGRVVDFQVKDHQLVETVRWAVDVPENKLANIGWRMTEAGYLRAVSVGFWPVRMVSRGQQGYSEQIQSLGLAEDESAPHRIFVQQEQVELSAVVIGANPNALAKAYKAGAIGDGDLDLLTEELSRWNKTRDIALSAARPAVAEQRANEQGRGEFLKRFEQAIKRL